MWADALDVIRTLGTEPLGRDGRVVEPEPIALPLRYAQPLLTPGDNPFPLTPWG